MDKRGYAEDKPINCAYCYFWSRRGKKCRKSKCYYLLPKKESVSKEAQKKVTDCDACPYSRRSPCMGYCLQNIILEMKQKKQDKEKEGGRHSG